MKKKANAMPPDTSAPSNNHEDKNLMKMKELSDATGVNSATIRYYINQGLLPRPYKTHKNMAYYDKHYIDLIILIKRLQKEYFLPLDVIKDKIKQVGYKKAPYMAEEIIARLIREKHIPQLSGPEDAAGRTPLTREEILETSGLSAEDFDAAVEVGFITVDEDGRIDYEYLELAMLLAELRKHLSPDKGFAIDFLTMHLKTLEELASQEISTFLENFQQGETSEDEINNFVHKSVNLFHKLAPVIHRRMLVKKIKDSLNF